MSHESARRSRLFSWFPQSFASVLLSKLSTFLILWLKVAEVFDRIQKLSISALLS